MHTNTINTAQSNPAASRSSTPMMRTSSAPDARGFAQIMQAFAPESNDSIADTIAQDQDAQIETGEGQAKTDTQDQDGSAQKADESERAEPNDQSDQAADQGAIDPSDGLGDGPGNGLGNGLGDGAGDQGGQIDNQIQPESEAADPQPGGSVDQVRAEDAAIRMLENQSEQAKLSIKGLVRSMIQGAGADSTAMAVEINLGQIESGARVIEAQQTKQGEQQAASTPPKATPTIVPTMVPTPVEPRTNESQAMNQAAGVEFARVDPNRSGEPGLRVEQASPQAAQESSQRADVGSAVSQVQAQPMTGRDQSVINQSQAQAQALGVSRSGSAQSVRAISSIDAGQLGDQQSNMDRGAFVERMKSAQVPAQTNRAAVMAQVQRGLASLLRSGGNEMTLKLMPGNLGEVRIRIKSGESGLRIRFETTSEQTTKVLEDRATELSTSLRSKGITLDRVQVEHTPTAETSAPSGSLDGSDAQASASDQQSNQEQGRSDQQGQPDARHRDEPEAQFSQEESPQAVWTELGLDAIA